MNKCVAETIGFHKRKNAFPCASRIARATINGCFHFCRQGIALGRKALYPRASFVSSPRDREELRTANRFEGIRKG